MSKSERNGLYILFAVLIMTINGILHWMSIFDSLVICCLAMVIIKLTDIEETIGELKKL